MKVSHHQIELPLFCMLKMVKYRHFITKLASSSTKWMFFLEFYDPSKHIRRHLMGVDRLDFPLAQPEKPSATSDRILQWFHTACGVGKKEKVKNQLIHGIFELFMARCWERYWKKDNYKQKWAKQGHFLNFFKGILIHQVVVFQS